MTKKFGIQKGLVLCSLMGFPSTRALLTVLAVTKCAGPLTVADSQICRVNVRYGAGILSILIV